jgi:hypothetical protein
MHRQTAWLAFHVALTVRPVVPQRATRMMDDLFDELVHAGTWACCWAVTIANVWP